MKSGAFPLHLDKNSGEPILDGGCIVQGLRQSVKVIRDEYGVPYIQTTDAQDAWFGLGFCQAQDRLFQLELIKRQARGTLCEIFGSITLPADRFSRHMGYHRIAREYLQHLGERQLCLLNAFTAGINQGMQKGMKQLPLEFNLLEASPTFYEPADIIAIQFLLTQSLSHWVAKLARFQLLITEGVDAVERTDPAYAAWNYVISPVGKPAGDQIGEFIRELEMVQKIYNRYGISNNWVVSANLSQTGRPILGNDPHLAAELPAPWYLASLECEEFHLNGACFPGSPFFLAGFNGFVSWGITAGFIDNIELYLEKYDVSNATVMRSSGVSHCKVLTEEIKLKDQPPQQEKIILTDKGLLLSPLYKFNMMDISLRATWFEPKEIEGFFLCHQSRNVNEFRQYFNKWPCIPINLVFSDSKGDIAWQLAGDIPDRKFNQPLAPLPGWDASFEWRATDIDFQRKPYLVNPPEGFIVTANNKPVDADSNLFIGRDYIDGYRQARQIHVLSGNKKKSWEDLSALQQDQYCQPWAEIRKKILAHSPKSQNSAAALQLLGQWDGILAADSLGATVYEFFIAEMTKRVVAATSSASGRWMSETFLAGVSTSNVGLSRISQVVRLMNDQPRGWFSMGWPEVIETCLVDTIAAIEKLFGKPGQTWEWGQVRKLQLRHVLTNLIPEVEKAVIDLFNPPAVAYGGDEQTVNVSAGDMCNPLVQPNFIANLRMMVETGGWENNSFSLAGGQSGNPFSGNYLDLYHLWLRGKGIVIHWNGDQVDTCKLHELNLVKDANLS